MDVIIFIYSISCIIGLIAIAGGANARSQAQWYKNMQPGILKSYVDLCTGLFIISFFASWLLPIFLSIL
jgi:hypothetical protein